MKDKVIVDLDADTVTIKEDVSFRLLCGPNFTDRVHRYQRKLKSS